MSFHRACRAAPLVLFACAALPASLSALVVAIKSSPVRLGVVSMSIHAGASRISPQSVSVGSALMKAPAVVAPVVGLHRIADKPKLPLNDPEDWEEPPDIYYQPLERIFTGYGAMAPRRKIGFLRKGESDIFEPSPWGPRRKIGFLRQGESEFFESYPSP